jgi:uncharacterized protein (TIGR02569 family)
MTSLRPPDRVLVAFGLPERSARAIGGGQGRAWSAGDLVLKPVDDVVEADWVADVLSAVAEDGFRINRPAKSATGSWVVEGWSAWEALPGEHDTRGRWAEVLHVGERLNAALSGLSRPAFLDSRTHAWAVGDRVAWGDEPVQMVHEALSPLADRLISLIRPDDSPSQVIHGDLAANVLFAPGSVPGVIDFTPYWRPARFCLAIVAVDALLWHGAPTWPAAAAPGDDDGTALLARAALYRLITSDRLAPVREPAARKNYVHATMADHERVLGLLERRAGGRDQAR